VARIVAAGGFVQAGRLCGDLDVVRALGDFEYKQPPVKGLGQEEAEAEEEEEAEGGEGEGAGDSGTTMARGACAGSSSAASAATQGTGRAS
jgi:hypothetical protein